MALVSDIQRTELTPLFKEGYLCAARCCDTHSPEGMQAWCGAAPLGLAASTHKKRAVLRLVMVGARSIDRCQTSADGARTFLDTAINEFHVRLCRVPPGIVRIAWQQGLELSVFW